MQAEVDQSGRIEFTGEDTVLALANGVEFSIRIPATVKRRCIHLLRQRGFSGAMFYTQLFAVGLYFLLKNHTRYLSRIVIDVEYKGRESQIKQHVINLLTRSGRKIPPDIIQFGRIGKKSTAHILGLETLRGNRKPSMLLTQADLLGEFRQ